MKNLNSMQKLRINYDLSKAAMEHVTIIGEQGLISSESINKETID